MRNRAHTLPSAAGSGRPRHLAGLLGLVLAVLGACASAPAPTPPAGRAPLRIAIVVATTPAGAAVDPETLGDWVGRATSELDRAGIELRVGSIHHTGPGSLDLRARARRRALQGSLPPEVLPVAIVPSLGRRAKGLWLPRDGIIVLGGDASRTALAHELGHALGLDHTLDPTNIMCRCDRTARPTFSPEQRRVLRRRLPSSQNFEDTVSISRRSFDSRRRPLSVRTKRHSSS